MAAMPRVAGDGGHRSALNDLSPLGSVVTFISLCLLTVHWVPVGLVMSLIRFKVPVGEIRQCVPSGSCNENDHKRCAVLSTAPALQQNSVLEIEQDI